ncbi:MAG: hypothetical protein FRX48_07518 [Lasallia pustulata]|uniref:Rho-GAP domain-containing protein n=1 Tax=Lasallia pustulata TaxID=136370 RepID=A0A5M8PHV8_9LECA|nr:MAG: hypothetical protein FRX48_07518 [Lasallia pustulata]
MSAAESAASPPSKRDLASWWKTFKKNTKKEEERVNVVNAPAGIFGVPLHESIIYANVAISLMNEAKESFIYGYVPIVVAKCGVFLKEKATDVEGIFRLSGSAKRIKELQAVFDSPDRYGKGLDWTGYTVHDAANILRRYLNQLPQPIVPLDFYDRFRDPLRSHQAQAVGDMEAQAQDIGDFDGEQAIRTYQRLITELPPLNRQLLLYILDLLSVFASKSDLNRMTSANLAAIFQPGLISHPSHDMSPQEYRLSQDVLIFLIENQDNFLIGMTGTAVDEKTVREVQSGASPRQPSTPTGTKTTPGALGRSASGASAGADSLRKFGGIRRNVSVSSKHSKTSSNVPSPMPASPGAQYASTPTSNGVHRSNTVPSNKSPALSTSRFNREPLTPNSSGFSPGGTLLAKGRSSSPGSKLVPAAYDERTASTSSSITPTAERPTTLLAVGEVDERGRGREVLLANDKAGPHGPATGQGNLASLPALVPVQGNQSSTGTPSRERKASIIFTKSPGSDGERKDARQPNKLRKKRVPGSANPSAHSSTNSLQGSPDSPANQAFYTPMPTPGAGSLAQSDPMASLSPIPSSTKATPFSEMPPPGGDGASDQHYLQTQDPFHQFSGATLKPRQSSPTSLHSRSSLTDHSELEHIDDQGIRSEQQEKKSRWRLSSSGKKIGQLSTASGGASSSQLGSNAIAERSASSVGSFNRPRKSFTNDSHQFGTESSSTGLPSTSTLQHPSNESGPVKDRDMAPPRERAPSQENAEKKGPIGWLKAKVAQAKEDRKEREAEREKERAKSPSRNGSGNKPNLPAASALESMPVRGKSMDVRREEVAAAAAGVPIAGASLPGAPVVGAPLPAAPLSAAGMANGAISPTDKTPT